MTDGSSDWDKLQLALETLTTQLGLTGNGSVASDVMDFWTNLPVAQQIGIVLGCITFTCTVGTVLLLLIWGGSFQRMQQQAITEQATQERHERLLWMQHLLDARDYMMRLKQATNDTQVTRPTTTTMMRLGQVRFNLFFFSKVAWAHECLQFVVSLLMLSVGLFSRDNQSIPDRFGK